MRPVVYALVLMSAPAWAQPAPEPTPPVEAAPAPPAPPVEAPPPEAKPDAATTQSAAPDNGPVAKPVVAEPVVAEPEMPHVVTPPDKGFRFGSYGRVSAGSDLRGGKPERVMIVGHGPRIVEPSYLELEFSYGFVHPHDDTKTIRPVITLAFDDTLFHETGQFDAQPALRNMFLDAQVAKGVGAWVGSRMYRGDDIYLFDYWPLDDQNLVGGGISVHPLGALEFAGAIGFNRLEHPFQHQEIEVANPVQGATTVEQLNRQRTVASATATYTLLPPTADGIGFKAKVHSEVHSLPSGTRKRDDGTLESLPADSGLLVGAELGAFGFADPAFGYRRHINGFVRYAKGLAAFDELAPPTSFGPELKTNRASELSFGLSANWDHALGQLMAGVLSRRFIDADGSNDSDDGWEYALDIRPLARIVPDWYVGADLSYQARFPKGLNPITLRAEDPAEYQIAPMIAYSPMGPSAYDRPQLRLVYRAAHRNQAALDEFVPDDPQRRHAWTHFLGVQAEWWFNSSTYR
jgi:maltoporin